MTFDRKTYFDLVRESLFNAMTQQQVDGQEYILDAWEEHRPNDDMRWLANFLAQSFHETGAKMWPIEEYQGAEQPYGAVDPETGQRYYGRGLIQITHRENYARADEELNLPPGLSCEWHADNMLFPNISARAGYQGMFAGWFREGHLFDRYFNEVEDDPFGAREIVNGDKTYIPSWSDGKTIGELVAGYHAKFLDALRRSFRDETVPAPEPAPQATVLITVAAPPEVKVEVKIVNPGGSNAVA